MLVQGNHLNCVCFFCLHVFLCFVVVVVAVVKYKAYIRIDAALWMCKRPLWIFGSYSLSTDSYTIACPPVRGLSYVQVDKHDIIILYHLHQCRPCTS